MIPMVVYLFLSIQLLFVAYTDFKTRMISNFWPIINIFLFLNLTWIFPQTYVFKWQILIFPIAFIFVGFILFLMKIMGGGDSKYLSSMFLLIPIEIQDTAFIYLLYTTVIVGSTLIIFNLLKNFDRIWLMAKTYDVNGIKKLFGKKFTYAPVIFIAWMWFGWQNRMNIH
jgi:prepilin peptidase CpaA